MTDAEAPANLPEEVKADAPVDDQKPEAAPAETKTETEESATKEEPSANDESEAKEEPAAKDEEDGSNKEGDAKSDAILKTKGKIDFDNKRNNRKFDPTARDVTDDPVAIRKQTEFYFGDWNFPQDKFMWEQSGGVENKPIPVAKIHSFKRMQVFQPYSAVVAALRDSTFLVLEGEEGKETIKRKVPYQPASTGKAKSEAATVYVKGFGDEEADTQYDLESFFEQYGSVKGIKLRRTNEGFFKGSVFVTFATEDEAKAFINHQPQPKWKDHSLKIMSKRDYCQEKTDLIRQGKLEPNSQTQKKFFEGKEGQNRSGGRGGFRGDNDDWNKRRDHDQRNGFRGGRGGGRGRGRGGRGGRGRGDRDRFRDRDGGRDGPREQKENGNNTAAPTDKAAEATNGKRARDDDAPAGEPVAKKVDVKDS